MASVSAALIVRDEERFLPGCLSSISGIVDEIIVVDTGSVDDTRQIARDAGATLLEFPWTGDFAAARNFGLEAARADWILYIDADERLAVPAGVPVADALSQPGVVAATLRFRPFVRATPYREYRLFRNDPRIRFQSAIHETIVPSVRALCAQGGRIVHTDSEITHLGYEGDLTRKYHRNLPLLRDMIVREPRRPYYWHDLAATLAALGETEEAVAVARQGLDVARLHDDGESRAVGTLIAWTLATLLLEQGAEALPVIEDTLVRYPGQASLLFLKARILIDKGHHDEALGILDGLLAQDPTTFCDPHVAYDERIFGVSSLELSAVALLRLGRRQEAAKCMRRAAKLEPGELSYRVKAAALGGVAAEMA